LKYIRFNRQTKCDTYTQCVSKKTVLPEHTMLQNILFPSLHDLDLISRILSYLSGQYIAECLYACVHVNLEAVKTIRVSALVRVSVESCRCEKHAMYESLGSPTAPISLL